MRSRAELGLRFAVVVGVGTGLVSCTPVEKPTENDPTRVPPSPETEPANTPTPTSEYVPLPVGSDPTAVPSEVAPTEEVLPTAESEILVSQTVTLSPIEQVEDLAGIEFKTSELQRLMELDNISLLAATNGMKGDTLRYTAVFRGTKDGKTYLVMPASVDVDGKDYAADYPSYFDVGPGGVLSPKMDGVSYTLVEVGAEEELGISWNGEFPTLARGSLTPEGALEPIYGMFWANGDWVEIDMTDGMTWDGSEWVKQMPEIDRWMEPLLAEKDYIIEIVDEVPRVVVSVDGVERPAFEYVGGMWVELHQEGADLPPKYEESIYYERNVKYDFGDGILIPMSFGLGGDSMAQLVSEIHPTEKYVQEVLGPQYITSAWHLYTEMEGNEDVTREEFVERLKAGATDPSKRVVLKVAYMDEKGAVRTKNFDILSGAYFVWTADGDQEQLQLPILISKSIAAGDTVVRELRTDIQVWNGRLVLTSQEDMWAWDVNEETYIKNGRTPELRATFRAQVNLLTMLTWWGCLSYEEMVDDPGTAVDTGWDSVKDQTAYAFIKAAYDATLNVPGATETDLMRVVLP